MKQASAAAGMALLGLMSANTGPCLDRERDRRNGAVSDQIVMDRLAQSGDFADDVLVLAAGSLIAKSSAAIDITAPAHGGPMRRRMPRELSGQGRIKRVH